MISIFCGNLPFDASDADLRGLFEPYGEVSRAKVVTDKASGQSKGFGFVEMPEGGEGEAAIAALDGQDYAGRALTVNEARPPELRPKRRNWD